MRENGYLKCLLGYELFSEHLIAEETASSMPFSSSQLALQDREHHVLNVAWRNHVNCFFYIVDYLQVNFKKGM